MKKFVPLLFILLFSCTKTDISLPNNGVVVTRVCWECKEIQGNNSVNYELCGRTEDEIRNYEIVGNHILTGINVKVICVKKPL